MKKNLFFILLFLSTVIFAQNVKVLDLTSNTYTSGTSFYVAIGSQMQVTANYTFEGWLYVESKGSGEYPVIMDRRTVFSFFLIDKPNGGTGDYRVRFVARNTNDIIIASLRNDGTDTNSVDIPMSYDTWYHVAVSRDGTTARLFINGAKADETTDSDFILSTPTGNSVNYGARYWGGYERYLDGALDEMRYSDIGRYTANFSINKHSAEHATSGDSHTILLFNFNNSDLGNTTSANTYKATAHGTLSYEDYDGLSDDLPLDGATPVQLTSFSANVTNSGVLLKWKTATEVNNYGFAVERKYEAGNGEWEEIGFVEGHGNSNSPNSYSFTDNSAEGNVSYRLKQVDNNGDIEYSDVVAVNVSGLKKVELAQNYPNPFNPSTTFSFTIPAKGFVTLAIYNSLGQKVADVVNGNLEAGSYKYNWNAGNLTSGVYFAKLTAGAKIKTQKIMLMK